MIQARSNIIRSICNAINSSSLTRRPTDKPCAVVSFGSTQFGLDSDTSDLDLCILDPDLPHGPQRDGDVLRPRPIYMMRNLAQLLSQAGFKHICPVPFAHVPIVKFRSPDGTIAGDLNCNNTLGWYNSQLLKAYHALNPSLFRPMGMTIKLWAKARRICDPAGVHGPKSLSSYTLVLLLIRYLQGIGQLPNLQDEHLLDDHRTIISAAAKRPRIKRNTKPPVELVKHDTSFISRPPSWSIPPPEDLAKLLLGFFQFYDQFDFSRLVVSVRSGVQECERRPIRSRSPSPTTESKDAVASQSGLSSYHTWPEALAVEDPFIRTR